MKYSIYIFVCIIGGAFTDNCIPRSYGYDSVVCVCNASYCDEVPKPEKPQNGHYSLYISSRAGLRFERLEGELKNYSDISSKLVVIVNPAEKYQTVFGWGGSFTDSTGHNINSLSQSAAFRLMSSYFSENGSQYNMARVPIGATDFSPRAYTYNDGDTDMELLNFNLTIEDFTYKIPLIKQAKLLSKAKFKLLASAWTSPIWMKHNGKYTGPDVLRKNMYRSWANYHLKFLRAYRKEGIDFWGMTTGNEPSLGLFPSFIVSLGWLPWHLGSFISDHLGPTIRNSEFKSLKLLTVDDQLYFFPIFIDAVFSKGKAKEYIDGFGLHYYFNWLPKGLLRDTHAKYPDKFILATEACEGVIVDLPHVKLGDWERGESYAADIILDMNNWVTGWIDFNLAVDTVGGPTYIKNYVDAPIIVNSTADEFYKQPMYYALAHFSKFVLPGSKRIEFTQSSNELLVSAFLRPDNAIVLTILNRKLHDVSVLTKGIDTDNQQIFFIAPPKSISTVMYSTS